MAARTNTTPPRRRLTCPPSSQSPDRAAATAKIAAACIFATAISIIAVLAGGLLVMNNRSPSLSEQEFGSGNPPPSALEALAAFAQDHGLEFTGQCSTLTQAGQLCYRTSLAEDIVKTNDGVQLRLQAGFPPQVYVVVMQTHVSGRIWHRSIKRA